MKTLFTILTLFLSLSFAHAQENEEKPKAKEEYCMVILDPSQFRSSGINISVDFGQKSSGLFDRKFLRDENDKKMEFDSIIDALNYLASLGWEFVNEYAAKDNIDNTRHHYILKRKTAEPIL